MPSVSLVNVAVLPVPSLSTAWLPSSSAWFHRTVAGLASRFQPGTPLAAGLSSLLDTRNTFGCVAVLAMAVSFSYSCRVACPVGDCQVSQ